MKKLYQNIENVHILGGVDQLTDLVQTMDVSLQNIADSTDRLTEYLLKFNSSNSGKRFDAIVNTTVRLRDGLFDDALALNDMQNQLVQYQNKIFRYEGIANSVSRPNPFLAQKRPISTETSQMQFHRGDMLQLIASLKNYSSSVLHHLKIISEKRYSAGQIWRDTQYRDFSSFVDDVIRNVQNVLKEYDVFIRETEEKIKEMD